jgi:PAS domain S-box-containing protein
MGILMVICDEQGISTDKLLSGLPFDKTHLMEPANFIDWDSLTTIIDRIAEEISDSDFMELSVASYKHPMYRLYRTLGRLRFNLIQFYLYLMGPDGMATQFYPIYSELLSYDTEKRHLAFRFSVAEGLTPNKNFFRIIEGQAIGISEVLGYKKSKVVTQYEPDHVNMWIELPVETGLLPKVRRFLMYPLDLWSSARSLQLTHDTLLKRNRELEAETERLNEAKGFLRVQKEQLDLLNSNQSMMFWTLNLSLEPLFYSESVKDMMGYTPEEAVALPALALNHPDSHQVAYDKLAKHLAMEQIEPFYGSVSTRLKALRKDGSTFWTESHASFLRNGDGEAIGILGVTIDIDDRLKIEQRQQALESELIEARQRELVGRVAGGVAHDFNNALQSVIGFAEMTLADIERDNFNNADIKHYNQQILKAASNASDLVRQLLALGRRQTLALKFLDLAEWLQDASTLLDPILDSNIKLETNVPPGLSIEADPIQLERVLANLSLNAKDAMPNGGTFTISAHRDSDTVELTFTDSGTGIPETILDQIFEPFFSSKDVNEGSGLGLAVSAGIIEQHGGEITATSTEGEGTTIAIRLPYATGPSKEHNFNADEVPDLPGSHQILLVDDKEVIRSLVKSMLQDSDTTTIEAVDGLDAVEQFQLHADQIDLVLMDIVMPRQNGDVAAAQIRKLAPSIPVIFMTGYAGNDSNLSSLQKETILNKPFTRHQLMKTLAEHLVATPDNDVESVLSTHSQID